MPRSSAFGTVSLAMTLITAASAQNVISARPGTIDYVEGQASLVSHTAGEDLSTRMAGTVSLGAGESLKTADGRAEVQLTPGIYLRVGQNSRVKMISPSLVHTVLELQGGRAEVEVDQLLEQNDVRINMGSGPTVTQTQLVKPGIYEFDADAGLVRVFEGRAEVSVGENAAKLVSVKPGHLLAVSGDSAKPQGFSKKKSSDDLIAWGDLRSQYAGQENAGLVQSGAGGYGNGFNAGGYGSGLGAYPWFPGSGFNSPYGLGLYSSFYGGPFGFGYSGLGYSGFGYPGFGYGFLGGSGYGFGGLGFGGYGYAGVPGGGIGLRNGYTGQFGNRGPGRPGPARGAAPASRSGSLGTSQGANAGFRGGGGGGATASHSSGGGSSHR